MGKISEFKAALTNGGARANQFRVGMTFPTAIGFSVGTEVAGALNYLCNAASLPGSSIGQASMNYNGRLVKFVGDREFQDWTITVINDASFGLHDAFEKWMNAINDVTSNGSNENGLNIENYDAQLEVEHLDRNDVVLRKYVINDAWPVSMSPISLSWDANNQIETFQVTFTYTSYTASTPQV